jgi:hypothetical protein
LLIEQQIAQYRALDEWFQKPLGLSVAKEFTQQLEMIEPHLRGEILLQLGHCGHNPWLHTVNYLEKWIASPFFSRQKINLECALNQLPLYRHSVDCVLLPLTLEPFINHLSLLDEIDRILKPMGYVVLLGMNPWSIWGAALKLGLLRCYGASKIKMNSSFHLNRIFLQRGYRQCALINFGYIPPVPASLIQRLSFLDKVGKMLWPYPTGFYIYVVQKEEYIPPSMMIPAECATL